MDFGSWPWPRKVKSRPTVGGVYHGLFSFNPYAINGPYMFLKATLSTDQWTIYGLLRIQTVAITSNLQFWTE